MYSLTWFSFFKGDSSVGPIVGSVIVVAIAVIAVIGIFAWRRKREYIYVLDV